jgi:hypothetical protein
MVDISECSKNVMTANIKVLQQITMISLEAMHRFPMLQMKTYQSILNREGLSRIAGEWQDFFEDSTRKTIELVARAQADAPRTIAAEANVGSDIPTRSTEDVVRAIEQTVANA